MTARYPSHPDEPWSKLDDAINRGFDPGEDYGCEPALGPITPAMARYNHQGSPNGCDNCGVRCDRCNERTCNTWGPERRACGTTCVDCSCSCGKCLDAREDMRADLQHRIQGEGP